MNKMKQSKENNKTTSFKRGKDGKREYGEKQKNKIIQRSRPTRSKAIIKSKYRK